MTTLTSPPSVRDETPTIRGMAVVPDRMLRWQRLAMVIGSLKPVVLLPAALLTGMSSTQLEAILAHELAHIR